MSDDDAVETTTGNVFADLGLPQAEERLRLAELARHMTLPEGWRWCLNPACPMYATASMVHAHERAVGTPGVER